MDFALATGRQSGWERVLSLLLVLAVGLQGTPLQGFVQGLHSAPPHHECSHEKGYCPMNPGGPCECDRDAPAPDVPTLRPCPEAPTDGLPPAVSGKWVPAPSGQRPSPLFSPASSRAAAPTTLSSQYAGDDIFRPPRTQFRARRA